VLPSGRPWQSFVNVSPIGRRSSPGCRLPGPCGWNGDAPDRRRCVGPARGPPQYPGGSEDLADLPLVRYPHDLFLRRIWELRHDLTACDAAYVALAEALAAPLVTRDAALAARGAHRARVELV
jgi:hypothetical protein